MWRFALGRLLRYFIQPLLRDTLYLIALQPWPLEANLKVVHRCKGYGESRHSNSQ
jgi:hypothetical protein